MSMRSLIKALKGLWSLAVGLRITAVELVKPQITVHYPREEVKNLVSYRGHIELVPLDADLQTPRCIICWRCVDNCPSRCITLRMHVKGEEAGRAADPGLRLAPDIQVPYSQHRTPPPDVIERVLDVYRLSYSLCSLCGLCVQNCPVDAIRFTGNAYLVGTTRQTFDIDLLARLRQRAAATVAARGTARAA
jgi:NADH-quinone oxidoreductase subunit I